jgi:dihydroorotase-like cyclic amidohydrolase
MEQIEWARSRGIKVYAETCPQYLVLTADHLKGAARRDGYAVLIHPQFALWE